MKRKLSLLMVLMMMLTLIPANMAFAASDSVVNTVVTSSDGTVDFDLDIELKGAGVTSGGIFEITLSRHLCHEIMDGRMICDDNTKN